MLNANAHIQAVRADVEAQRFSTGFFMTVLALAMALLIPSHGAAQMSPDAASAQCHAMIASVDNPNQLAGSRAALIAVKRCVDLGADPPLKIRANYGRHPSPSAVRAQVPGTTCPPFATCLYNARVNTGGSQPLNYGETRMGAAANSPGLNSGAFSAPEFIGHLPSETPAHLVNGSTMYFYGDVSVTPPDESLVYPDSGMNYYTDGGMETLSYSHIMVPPAPDGRVMEQRPTTVHNDATMKFDDGGVIVLPDGFTGTINNTQVQGGDVIVVNHPGDLMVPAGTKLYPFPAGSHPQGSHRNNPNYEPYTGPMSYPTNSTLTLAQQNQPGAQKWW